MNDLTERELSRLSYLVDALVCSPRLFETLTGNILDPAKGHGPASPSLHAAVEALKTSFAAAFQAATTSSPTDLDTLRHIAADLSDRPVLPIRMAGRVLQQQIEMVAGPSPAPSSSRPSL